MRESESEIMKERMRERELSNAVSFSSIVTFYRKSASPPPPYAPAVPPVYVLVSLLFSFKMYNA